MAAIFLNLSSKPKKIFENNIELPMVTQICLRIHCFALCWGIRIALPPAAAVLAAPLGNAETTRIVSPYMKASCEGL